MTGETTTLPVAEYEVYCPFCGQELEVETRQAVVDGVESGSPSGTATCDCGMSTVVKEEPAHAVEGTTAVIGYDFPE